MVTFRASGSIAVTVSCRKRTPGFAMGVVWKTHSVHRCPAEQHVQLGVAKHERAVLVDQDNVDVTADSVRQHGRELEASEARSQDDDPLHRRIVIDCCVD